MKHDNQSTIVCQIELQSLKNLREEELDHTTKGLPFGARITPAQVRDRGWNVLKGDLPFPLLVMKESALEHNLREMAVWCADHGLLLAPHGKTTMCPQIYERQIAHGAWAITVATVSQALVCASFGISRIVIANQISGASNLHSLSELLNSQREAELYCLIDSVDGVRHLAEGLERYGARRPINVLLEWGRKGWRTGVRSEEQGIEVWAEAARHSHLLKLCGIEAFEGLASSEDSDDEARQVDEFFIGLRNLGQRLRADWLPNDQPILSIGGSAFLDRVIRLAPQVSDEFRVVVRSGCYVTHDHIQYQHKQAASMARGRDTLRIPEFIPALELWAYVQSMPEEKLAFLTFGKRDCPHDLGLPKPLFAIAEGDGLSRVRDLSRSAVVNLNDQHAYLALGDGEKLEVGDLLCFGISHPCTAFDKWRVIPVVNDDYEVIDLYRTFF
ncbi:MAG: amino acid deaminase [Acidobacteria bacterium]|nr:amino acid deaminase [Acidobacteriota bacterium]